MAMAVKTMRVGQDILLARHGDRIVKMRQDRRTDCTVALLEDGTSDSAPNRIVSHARLQTVASAPVQRAMGLADRYRKDELPVSRTEVRWFAKLTAVWALASTAIAGGMVWWASAVVDPATLSTLLGMFY